MFRVIDEMFEWSPFEFESINKECINAIFENLVQRKYFMFGTNDYLDDFKQYLIDKSMVVLPRQSTALLLIPPSWRERRHRGDYEAHRAETRAVSGIAFTIHECALNPGQATIALGVTLDNKLIGVYAFSAASTVVDMSKYVDTPNIFDDNSIYEKASVDELSRIVPVA